MRLWVADGEKGLMVLDAEGCRAAGPPVRLVCGDGRRLFCAGGGRCFGCGGDGKALFHFPVPSGACGIELGREMVYLLSSDSDSLGAWSAATGEMAFSAPAGVYSRSLDISPDKRYLAVAGGAAGEIIIFNERLERMLLVRVPGVAAGVCFLSRGLAALCAVGDGEGGSVLLRISPRGVTHPVFSCPEMPCCLCRAGEGCIACCCQRAYVLSAQGRLLRTLECGCPENARAFGGVRLIADPCLGRVLLDDGRCVYRGGAPGDALLIRD